MMEPNVTRGETAGSLRTFPKISLSTSKKQPLEEEKSKMASCYRKTMKKLECTFHVGRELRNDNSTEASSDAISVVPYSKHSFRLLASLANHSDCYPFMFPLIDSVFIYTCLKEFFCAF